MTRKAWILVMTAASGSAYADGRERLHRDWLVEHPGSDARVTVAASGREIVLANGLIRRVFRVIPNAACVAFDDLMTDRTLLRAVRPEARLVIDGKAHDVGGLLGQPNHAFLLPQWLDGLRSDPKAFRYTGHEVGKPRARFAWRRVRHHAPNARWPPAGVSLRLDFDPPEGADELEGVSVSIWYELYDAVPVLSKWITVTNGSTRPIEIDRFTSEILAVVEHDNPVEYRAGVEPLPPSSLHVETDYAFGGFTHRNSTRHSVHWKPDPHFSTQVNYLRKMPCLLEVEPSVGPDRLIGPGDTFESFRAFELVHDSSERERRGLALRRMYRTIAPWVTENPLIFHVVSSRSQIVRRAIEQAAECGFEMVSLSFGSGLDMENESDANRAKFRELADYARSKGIELGGYSLLSSRRVKPDSDNCINVTTGKPGGSTHGFCPALASSWGQDYFRRLRQFFESTGFRQFTHDGSYPGDFDAAARPPLQRGYDDSQWTQWKIITGFYEFLRERGAYLRVPDYYFLSGANECGMGYRETNWSLPRAQQLIHTRQNIFDGTWEKTPSMGWMFVPLTQYHGGGAAATIEPLSEHIDHYRLMLRSNLAMGVQAVYRGTRLHDSPEVRDMVREETTWFKGYRDILESDMIHGRRADGRSLDWMLHVNPRLALRKAMLVVFNPTRREITGTLRPGLYYSGIRSKARVAQRAGPWEVRELDRDESLEMQVTLGPMGTTWYLFSDAR